jgi:hypothetical protein
MVKEIGGKRKVFERSEKILVAPGGAAGVQFEFRHNR